MDLSRNEVAMRNASKQRKRHCANYREWIRRANEAQASGHFKMAASIYDIAAMENEFGGGSCAERKTEISLARAN
jgi:hypothetical protein